MSAWEIVITGCGTSHGNPPFGHPELWSLDPRDHRRRSGAILRGPDEQVLLIDCGPDLLDQFRDPYKRWDRLSYPQDCITRVDGVLLTHDHADHSHGINDLRHVNRLMGMRSIPIFGHHSHLNALQRMFPFCFRDETIAYVGYRPCLEVEPLRDGEVQTIAGLGIVPFAMSHGPAGRTTGFRCGTMAYLTDLKDLPAPCLEVEPLRDGEVRTIAGLGIVPFAMSHGPAGRTTGFRCGTMAYLTDLKDLPAPCDAYLQGLDLLVLDMLREREHETHLCWAEAQAIIARLRPRRTVVTHMGHEVRYAEWEQRLGPDVTMAVDGMRLRFAAG